MVFFCQLSYVANVEKMVSGLMLSTSLIVVSAGGGQGGRAELPGRHGVRTNCSLKRGEMVKQAILSSMRT